MSNNSSEAPTPFEAGAFRGPSMRKKREVPDGLWMRCDGCEGMIYRKVVAENMEVCPECQRHFRVSAPDRIRQLTDPDSFEELFDDIAPDDPLVLKPLADLYFAAGRLDDAEPMYQGLIDSTSKARKRSKELAPYHFKLGCVAEARGDAEAAAKQYDTAYRIDTTYTPVVLAIGKLAMEQQDWDKARRIYRAMLLQNIDEAKAGISKADVYYNLGLIHEQLDEGKKAVNMFERGLEIKPDHADIQAALARVKG